MTKSTFSIIGGDDRSVATAGQLCALGFDVHIFGFDAETSFDSRVHRAKTLTDAVQSADFILLPLPCSGDGEHLNTPLYAGTLFLRDLLPQLQSHQLVFAGKIPPLLRASLEGRHITCHDYAEREEFSVQNAIPTAEGAIEIALRELPFTLNGSRCLVTGFGRISKALCHCLQGMGARVTTAARRHSDLAWIKTYGYNPIHTNDLKQYISQFQIIFNTVPEQLLHREILSLTAKDCLIVDLASSPGGVDKESAEKLGIRVIHALSLPGKVAPLTAGKIIGDTVLNIISESEVKA